MVFGPFSTVGDVLQHKHERLNKEQKKVVDRSRIKLAQLENEDVANQTSLVRQIEMELDGLVNYNVGITMQFFTDFQLYGLHEAIQYLAGYEAEGMVPKGSAEGIRTYAHKVLGIT